MITLTPYIASSWGQHGAHPGPIGPRWAPCWSHELCYLGHLHLVPHICISESGQFVPKGPIDNNPASSLDNGSAPTKRQAIIWTNADLIHWCIHAALGVEELMIAMEYVHCIIWFMWLFSKARVTLCRSGGPDIYDLKIVENSIVGSERHGNIVRTFFKSVWSGKDRQWSGSQYDSFKLWNVVVLIVTAAMIWHQIGRSVTRSCAWSEKSWTRCTQHVGSCGQRVGSRENCINRTMAICQIGIKFMSSNLQFI